MVFVGMQFSKEIGKIIQTWCPANNKLALADTVVDPIETHIHCLRPLGFQCVIGKADGAEIVGGDNGGRLRMAQVFSYLPGLDHLSARFEAAHSASQAEATTTSDRQQTTLMQPLVTGLSSSPSEPKYSIAPSRDPALRSER
jgi:hypothetical protein